MCLYFMTGLFIGALAFPSPIAASQSKDEFAATEKQIDFGAAGIMSSAHCRTNDLLALRLLGAREEIVLWDLASWKEKVKIPTKKLSFVGGLTFSPDGKKLAVGISDDKLNEVIEILGTETGTAVHAFQRTQGPIAFHPNGRTVAVCIGALNTDNGLGKIQFRDLNNSDIIQRDISFPKGTLTPSLAYAPDGKSLAVSSAIAVRKKGTSVTKIGKRKVEIYDSNTGASRLKLECHDWTNCMQFDGAGTTLATWTTVKSPQDAQLQQLRQLVYLWDPSNGKLRLQWKFAGPVRTVAFSADGHWLAAAIEGEKKGEKNSISVRDLRTGTEVCSIPLESFGPACRGLFFAKDGSLVYVGSSVLRSFKLEKK